MGWEVRPLAKLSPPNLKMEQLCATCQLCPADKREPIELHWSRGEEKEEGGAAFEGHRIVGG